MGILRICTVLGIVATQHRKNELDVSNSADQCHEEGAGTEQPETRTYQGDHPNRRKYRNTFGRPEPVGTLI